MKVGHAYERSSSCKERGLKDKFDMFIVTDRKSNGYLILNADGEELNTTEYSFHESDFDEIEIKEFIDEYGFRMQDRRKKRMQAALAEKKQMLLGMLLDAGLTKEQVDTIVNSCMNSIGQIRRYCEEHPELVEGRIIKCEEHDQQPLDKDKEGNKDEV